LRIGKRQASCGWVLCWVGKKTNKKEIELSEFLKKDRDTQDFLDDTPVCVCQAKKIMRIRKERKGAHCLLSAQVVKSRGKKEIYGEQEKGEDKRPVFRIEQRREGEKFTTDRTEKTKNLDFLESRVIQGVDGRTPDGMGKSQ